MSLRVVQLYVATSLTSHTNSDGGLERATSSSDWGHTAIRPIASLMTLSNRPLWMLPLGRIRPIVWLPAFALILLIDYFAGPDAPFPVFYVVPVILAAWYSGQMTALWLSLALPAQRFLLESWVWHVAAQSTDVVLMATMIRISTYTLLALATFRLSEHERALKRDLATLQGLLPLCARCKSIKNSESHWETLESYLESRSGAQFSHGLCPSCSRSALLE